MWLRTVRFSGESMISQMGGGWGHQSQKWGVNLSFGNFFAGSCMKMKYFGPRGMGGGGGGYVFSASQICQYVYLKRFWILNT